MASLLRFPEFPTQTEWIGGRYTLPGKVREGGKLVALDVALWLELPTHVIVGSAIIDPRTPLTFAQTLEQAMERPVDGEPRRPSHIRVSDARLADELRATQIPIVVAPTPEVDAAFADLSAAILSTSDGEGPEHSYLAGGTVAPAVVARLFTAAGLLFRTAPWRRVEEYQVVRVDIPSLGVDGACLSVIGAAGESSGLLLFRSLDVYRSFTGEPGPAPRSGKDRALLSLSFDRKKDIPPAMLREIEKHRWPVEGAKGYPVVMSLDDGMAPLRLTERDYRILTASTRAFLSFLAQHGDVFEMDDPDDVRASFTGEDGVTVTLTAPYGAQELFDRDGFFAGPEPARSPRAGRNDPCPCGSGKKYKKCHLDADESAQSRPPERPTVHQMDLHFVSEIGAFAHRRFGPRWLGPEMDLDEHGLTLFLPWIVWTSAVGGTRVADAYLQENAARLSAEEREWVAAQKRTWLSVWEVTHVEPGTIAVRDLLTGERRSISEELASKSLVARDVVLARVVDHRGTSYFGGLYARSLSPSDAAGVVDAVRSKLRVRQGGIAAEALRDPELGRFLIEQWRDAVRESDERRSRPPELRNTDGDPLLFVTESFRFAAKSRAEIIKRLAAMDGAERGDHDEILFFRISASGRRKRDDRTIIGRAVLTEDTLSIETNSEPRAEALARRIRDACAGLLRRAGRTAESPSAGQAGKPAKPPSERDLALVREYKEQHYRDWLDKPLPALGGKSPRAAARSAKSRETLDLLLRDMENHENRRPAAERFDFRRLRSELGLESFSPPE